jgi:hypothetical protein
MANEVCIDLVTRMRLQIRTALQIAPKPGLSSNLSWLPPQSLTVDLLRRGQRSSFCSGFQFLKRRFVRSRLARALIVRAASALTSPIRPPMARRPTVGETLGIIPHIGQLPLELPPEPPDPPLVPPGAAWFTCMSIGLLVGAEG